MDVKPGSFTGKLKDQIIMTIELAKYKSCEEDDNNISGVNKSGSNDVLRFQYDIDEIENQYKYRGSGLIGGDLEGFKSKVGHLKELGVTSIITYPFLKSDQDDSAGELPTGYGIVDWQKIDVNFRQPGESEDEYSAFAELVDELHKTDNGEPKLNVILDLAMTLCGNECPWTNPLTASAHYSKIRRYNPDNVDVNLSHLVNIANTGAHKWKTYTFTEIFDIREYFNEDVFSHNTDRTDGNMGGTGFSYPSEGIGNSMYEFFGRHASIKYRIGSKLDGDYNAVRGSQNDIKICIPTAKYAVIALAAAATGMDRKVNFRIEYEDGSFDENTGITVPVWDPEAKPAQYLLEFNHKHSISGEEIKQPVYMYSIYLTTDPTKMATAIYLVGSSEMENVHVFAVSGLPVVDPVKIDLADLYNIDLISSDCNKGDGNTHSGILFPDHTISGQKALRSFVNAEFVSKSADKGAGQRYIANFAIGPVFDGRFNMVQCQGQKLKMPAIKCHKLLLAAFATADHFKAAELKINFEDGSSRQAKLNIKSWTDSMEQEDILVHKTDHVHRLINGCWEDDPCGSLSIWGYSIDLEDDNSSWNKTISSVVLPDDNDIILAAMNPLICLDVNWGLTVLGSINSVDENKDYFDYFYNNVICYWLDRADFDGYRLDSVQNELPQLWAKINENFRRKYPGKVLIGEAGIDPGGPLPWQYHEEQYTNSKDGIGFDTIYDFGLAGVLRAIFALDKPADGQYSNLFRESIENDMKFEKPWNQMLCYDTYENWSFMLEMKKNVDEHGNERYPEYKDKLKKVKMAAAMVMTMNRIPLLFSGNEYLVDYGAHAPIGTNHRKPGFLFTKEVQEDPVYQDNYKYMKALINMRLANLALRSEERMTDGKWILKGKTLFGYVRQEQGSPAIAVLFNNSSEATGEFEARLPDGLTGDNNWNFIKKNAEGDYGAYDYAVSWPDANTIKVANMLPYEVKIIRINQTGNLSRQRG